MDSNGIGKLLPKAITQRRRKKNSIAGDGISEEIPRGRSAVSRETTESEGTTSVNTADEDNLYDSDGHEASSSAVRPATISTHPSQIGYLTTSSELVQADHLQEIQPNDQQPSDSVGGPTEAGEEREAGLSLTTKSSRSSLIPPFTKVTRSPSPVGRFKDVFRSKKSSTGTASPSPERRPTTADAQQSIDPLSTLDNRPPPATTQHAQEVDSNKVSTSERFRRLSKGQTIDTSRPPRTPPTGEKTTPVIVNTPPTPTDPRHSSSHSSPQGVESPDAAAVAGKTNASSPSSTMISQRRARSGSANLGPSKLSNITLAPLSPTPENGPTTPSGTGFFSSMISAAQNATNSLSNTITNTNIAPWNNNNSSNGSIGKKGISSIREPEEQVDDKAGVEVEPSVAVSSEQSTDSKELAVKTLGMGDLSLSQLGIIDTSSQYTTPETSQFPDSTENRARSESLPVEGAQRPASLEDSPEELQTASRVRSAYQPTEQGDRTTPTGSVYDGKSSAIQRSSSIRSAIGRRRTRGSSAATGTTGGVIGAAIAATNASIARPNAQGAAPKHTGFAVASKKRNRDFHTFFKSVPDDDYLIEDYSCALQREILAHGRLYVSEGHLCFSSNILGWVTTLVMSFDEIVSLEKRSTALVFKNGLMISTLHAKHVFASFTSRDSTYDLIVKIWKLGHPTLQSSLNGVRIDETGGDKTEKIEEEADESLASHSDASASEDESDDGDDVYDEDEDNDDVPETTQLTEPGSLSVDVEKAVTRKASGAVGTNMPPAEKPKDAPTSNSSEEFPGPLIHAATDCGEGTSHYEKILADDVVPAPMGKVFSMIFGPMSVTWMAKWLTNDQKCTDLQTEDTKGLGLENKSRTYSYIKPLSASLGPKQTKCIVTESVDFIDWEKAVHITCSTQNPDVPSGNVFSVKTKYCFSWAEGNGTRVQINCTVEWTGKSWLKGPIEKGVNDGQGQYCKDLFASLKAAVTARPRSGTLSNGAVGKGKKKGRKGKAALMSGPTSDSEGVVKPSVKEDWGLLEPLHGLVGPIVDIIRPLLTGNVMYGLLVGLLVASWFGFGFTTRRSPSHYGHDLIYGAYPDRLAAYEEMWRREESELWEWLEERVGLDRLNDGTLHTRKKVMEPRTVEEKIREDRMDDREIREAIKVTEDKLNVLKDVMGKRSDQGGESRAV